MSDDDVNLNPHKRVRSHKPTPTDHHVWVGFPPSDQLVDLHDPNNILTKRLWAYVEKQKLKKESEREQSE